MKKFCALVVLTLSITISTYANCSAEDGHMGCPGTSPPVIQPVLTNNDMDYPGLKEMAVSLLQSILSLS
jgi:hypothetical protein